MEKMTNGGKLHSPKTVWLILLTGFVANIFLSPKWLVPALAWLAPASFLLFIMLKKGRQKWLWLFLAFLASQTFASTGVIPVPLPILLIIVLVNSLVTLGVYCLQYWVSRKSSHFVTTLVFPSMYVTWEYFGSFRGGGVWGSMANTQFTFHYLAQLASVTGVWGISFLVFWFNAILVWAVLQYANGKTFKKPLAVYASIFLTIMIYGAARYHANNTVKQKITVSGVALSQLKSMEVLYEEAMGKKIKIDPTISQTSSELQEFNKAFIKVLENPDSALYPKSFTAGMQFNDSLFALTISAADNGAQLVLWAEANAIIYPKYEAGLLAKGKKVAVEKNIYLLMAYAVLQPGKIYPGKNFMENKTVFIGPGGNVLNVFHKNKPVPYAERSVPGNGIIPVINTSLGKASVSICYDADFPSLMKQLSKNKSDFLLLPSGDWFDISPMHTYMAAYRAIENGCPLIRDVKGGLSVATDYRGKIYSSSNFYVQNNNQWIFQIPVGHVSTIYSKLGDIVAYFSQLIFISALVFVIISSIKKYHINTDKITPWNSRFRKFGAAGQNKL